ncbi:class I SAM-dependent methyltransferase [Falsiroseomonas tokyonensis]|uniref:Class I SAM-dependent methyltransferase n=1 Tax=Falsiroseomonas tokyonensis TaxID=430521 RepID=A0ABV7BVL9_9PROT|nr:SAM-dependent methyltransferase [Falsiroseomonas tokyonensis]MBU8539697.1 SAM-dependent methyltransferase [Falsiroseomonas tokyonensis]
MERLDHFMARAIAAYYARPASPFGRAGDFTTAPEISQAFGEVLGGWAAVTWEMMGRPDPVLLVEVGPGRGTLMADALRAVSEVAAPFRAALRLHLVETSPTLRDQQRRMLGDAVAAWHDDLSTLPAGPMLLIGNEFLDALPIRQFIRREGAWRERFLAEGRFVEQPAEMTLPTEAPEGAVQEVGEAAQAVAAQLARRLATQGGAALFLDYGPAESGFGESLQAVRGQATGLDPLAEPGSADLTAHVDFAALARTARAAGAAALGPLPQGLFLQRLGLMTRAAMLARSRPRLAGEILSGAERLVAAEGMGRLFKALALCDPRLPTLPGFDPA